MESDIIKEYEEGDFSVTIGMQGALYRDNEGNEVTMLYAPDGGLEVQCKGKGIQKLHTLLRNTPYLRLAELSSYNFKGECDIPIMTMQIAEWVGMKYPEKVM